MATELNLFGRDDQVTVNNPTNRDFLFAWNSKKYKIPAGSFANLPGFMAEHYVKEMTNEMMQRANQEKYLMDENHRKPYYEKLIGNVISIAGIEDTDGDDDSVTTLGEGAIVDQTAKEVAKTAAAKTKRKDRVDELPDDAIDTPIDLDKDLPPEDDMEEVAKASAKKRKDQGETDEPVELEEAFAD